MMVYRDTRARAPIIAKLHNLEVSGHLLAQVKSKGSCWTAVYRVNCNYFYLEWNLGTTTSCKNTHITFLVLFLAIILWILFHEMSV
jgi:hypothetical protein